ncbi:assimilatory sulfite reductase (NADPH) flavoprotein subunit [Marinicella sediminis]|uniref:Sulfite reductase [NADPH] flavoprotein alpha-component n=1 Tax=Marinicella sediminis TaxID=1792834 RepID=A0ABV7J5U2_9GAMM|nr:assimilatory sulfite reductase (NADPH) flavoprotein subunit [Marinicella sediminis]
MSTNALTQLPQPDGSPIDPTIWLQLKQHINNLTTEQRWWLSGYLAALNHLPLEQQPAVLNNPAPAAVLTILYGSQTGNGKTIAEQLLRQASAMGISAQLHSMADYSLKKLAKDQWLSLVISTHGEGEAPDDAELFYEQLFSKRAPQLKGLHFNVLALGDSSYEWFCQTGKEIDKRLSELGGDRFAERLDCDVDYETSAADWISSTLETVKPELAEANNIAPFPVAQPLDQSTVSQLASKEDPQTAELVTIQKITGRGSVKDTYHLELAINPERIQYQPGDSLGIWADNDPNQVAQLLALLNLTGEEVLTFKDTKENIRTLLLKHIEITQVSKPLIQWLAQAGGDELIQQAASDHQSFIQYVADRQLLDVLSAQQSLLPDDPGLLLQQLKGITPRLYSIASSQTVHEDEVHLTINLASPSQSGFHGLASGLLCNRLTEGDELQVYVEPNRHFKLPANEAQNIIMIGPGTGIAPFRSFIQQRHELQHTGKNWLFFGNPNFATDFLYQTEWLKWHDQDVLNHLNLAFSRDQEDKHYVQHEIQREGERLWQWLDQGAAIYVCGDANRMAKDVEQALLAIFIEHGQLDSTEAKNHLTHLKREQRYQKDVY